jgi:hypothetical protein
MSESRKLDELKERSLRLVVNEVQAMPAEDETRFLEWSKKAVENKNN